VGDVAVREDLIAITRTLQTLAPITTTALAGGSAAGLDQPLAETLNGAIDCTTTRRPPSGKSCASRTR